MARSYQVSVLPATVTLIVDSTTKGGGPNVTIQNGSADATLYLGGEENLNPGSSTTAAALTSSTGYALTHGSSVSLHLTGGEAIYGIGTGTTGTCTAYVFRTSGAF